MSDVFYEDPGLSALRYEMDLAPRKHRCDILLSASAYALEGKSTQRVEVAARIGDWSKSFAVWATVFGNPKALSATSGALTLLNKCVMACNAQRLQRVVERERVSARRCGISSTPCEASDWLDTAISTSEDRPRFFAERD